MRELPQGDVTFLFTDIEGSTRLLQHLGAGYSDLLSAHFAILRAGIVSGDGVEVGTDGDSCFAVFPTALGGVNAAAEIQRRLAAASWSDGAEVRVRMGLHSGSGRLGGENYVGMDVHRAARIAAAGHGGQVVLSAATAELVRGDLPLGTSLRDLGRYRLKDLPHDERLYQLVVPDLPHRFPPLRTSGEGAANLPMPLSSFVGRRREIAAVTRLLRRHRMVTLVGPGGAGKTRLAVEVARSAANDFEDGVWLVELASVRDPDLVPTGVAAALGIPGGSGAMQSVVAESLHTKVLLMVLDNCEHVLTGCVGMVTAVLNAAPHTRLLATSRQPLGIPGEQRFSVPPLPVPATSEIPLDMLRRADAVRLFDDRARSVRPEFEVTADNASAVADLVKRLDGMPLAIELAAARMAMLTPAQVIARLDQRFRLLQSDSLATEPRHRTLRAAIEWSYDLLSGEEKTMLQRLSVFAGGCNLEAAEEVTSGEGIDRLDVLELVAGLAAKSLVVVEESNTDTRYLLLDSIREYAATELIESGAETHRRDRHAAWCRQIADIGDRRADGFEGYTRDIVDRFEAEHDNIRAGFDWSVQRGDADTALTIVGGIGWFWYQIGFWVEGLERCDAALQLPTKGHDLVRSRALAVAAYLASRRFFEVDVRPYAEECLELATRLDNSVRVGVAELMVAMSCLPTGDYERALELANHGYARAIAAKADALGGGARTVAGFMSILLGDFEGAVRYFEESERLYGAAGDVWRSGSAVYGQGMAAAALGQLSHASDLLERSLAIASHVGSRDEEGPTKVVLGYVHIAQGHESRGEELLTTGCDIIRTRHDWGGTLAIGLVSVLLAQSQRFPRAKQLLEGVLEMARELNQPSAIGVALTGLAQLCVLGADFPSAVKYELENLSIQTELKSPRGVADAAVIAAYAAMASGDMSTATQQAMQARALLSSHQLPPRPIERLAFEALLTQNSDDESSDDVSLARIVADAETVLKEAVK